MGLCWTSPNYLWSSTGTCVESGREHKSAPPWQTPIVSPNPWARRTQSKACPSEQTGLADEDRTLDQCCNKQTMQVTVSTILFTSYWQRELKGRMAAATDSLPPQGRQTRIYAAKWIHWVKPPWFISIKGMRQRTIQLKWNQKNRGKRWQDQKNTSLTLRGKRWYSEKKPHHTCLIVL